MATEAPCFPAYVHRAPAFDLSVRAAPGQPTQIRHPCGTREVFLSAASVRT